MSKILDIQPRENTVKNPQRFARLAGVLYFATAALGAFAQLFARAAVYVPGDASATADALRANAFLFRLGFVADVLHVVLFMFVGLALYKLLEPVNRRLAGIMVVFVAISVAVLLGNLIHHFGALLVATDPAYTAALGVGGADALVLLLLDLHHYGYFIAQLFFGLWLWPLGYLVYTSGRFPRALGVALVAACVSYLASALLTFTAPALAGVAWPLDLVGAAAEVWVIFYLLTVGIRTPHREPATVSA
jgi:hypothetical protein